jgi:hypothetical protein
MLTLLLLAATPVSLTVDLSRNTTARLGPKVRELIEQRLAEEGFVVEPGAKLKLGVEELHGTLRLSAQAGEYDAHSELRPAAEWPAELGFELAQRLAVLAHEAESHVPVKPPLPAVVEDPPAPVEPEPPPLEERPAPPPAERGLRLGAGLRLGMVVRVPSVDPAFSFHGAVPGGAVEPMLSMGLTFAPGRGLTAWEVPLLVGIRAPITLSSWSIVPELLAGGRLHIFSGTSLDPNGGVRIDPLGSLGVAVLRALGSLKLGVRVGIEVSTGREHLEGDLVLWARGPFAFSAMLQLER